MLRGRERTKGASGPCAEIQLCLAGSPLKAESEVHRSYYSRRKLPLTLKTKNIQKVLLWHNVLGCSDTATVKHYRVRVQGHCFETDFPLLSYVLIALGKESTDLQCVLEYYQSITFI